MVTTKPNSNADEKEFQKFDELLRGVVAVPKKEIDEREQQYQREKKTKKKKAV